MPVANCFCSVIDENLMTSLLLIGNGNTGMKCKSILYLTLQYCGTIWIKNIVRCSELFDSSGSGEAESLNSHEGGDDCV